MLLALTPALSHLERQERETPISGSSPVLITGEERSVPPLRSGGGSAGGTGGGRSDFS
jgi:hypothetical protein